MTQNTPETTGGDVTLNTVFSVLSHQARRRILARIHDAPSRPVDGFDLEYFVDRDAIPAQTRTELYHNHLPRLDAAGFIDWDPEANTVSPGPHFGAVEPVLELLEAHQDDLPSNWP